MEAVVRVHGGVKFYRGAAKAARAYVERDRSRADDYYHGEGTGVAERLTATPADVTGAGSMDGETYEQWVAGVDVDTGRKKGRIRDDANALRFVEVTVNGPKTWSLAAALHPDISTALDEAQDKAATEIVGGGAQHATTRVGPRGRQVQVPVEKVEAAVIRHAAVATDPDFRVALAARGFTSQITGGSLATLGVRSGPPNCRIEPVALDLLRTLCGLAEVAPPLNCGSAPIHTLKRNSTTSPSAIT